MKIQTLLLIGLCMLPGALSCSKKTAKETPPAKPEAVAQKPTPPAAAPTPDKPVDPPAKPAAEVTGDVSQLLVITDAFSLEHLGYWSEHFTIKGMPMLSENGEHMLRLQFNPFETAFAPSGEEAEPIGEFVIEKVRLSDLSVVQSFPLLQKKDIIQAQLDSRTKECVEKNRGAGPDAASGAAECPVDEKLAAIASAKKNVGKLAAVVIAELKAGQYTSMKTVPLKDPPAGEDGEEAEPPKNPDPELVYTVKVTKHRPTVRVLRKRDGKSVGEVTLQCAALPETSCTLGENLELFSDAKGRKVVVAGREVDMENGKVLASVVKVIALKTAP